MLCLSISRSRASGLPCIDSSFVEKITQTCQRQASADEVEILGFRIHSRLATVQTYTSLRPPEATQSSQTIAAHTPQASDCSRQLYLGKPQLPASNEAARPMLSNRQTQYIITFFPTPSGICQPPRNITLFLPSQRCMAAVGASLDLPGLADYQGLPQVTSSLHLNTKNFDLLVLVAALIAPSSAKFFTSSSQLRKSTYDYIVVGAGTAGNVVAGRLTEDPTVSVLVLEAGVSNDGVLASTIPLLAPSLTPNTIYDWNYTTTNQAGLNGRNFPYARGRMIGGSSSVNYLAYSHGSSDDYDRYASVTGDPGWSWENMAKYRKLNEKFVPPADDIIPRANSHRLRTVSQVHTSGGNVVGLGWVTSVIGNGTRSSSATAYLEPALGRPNLDVLINAQVTKLLQTGGIGGLPSFHSVQFAAYDGDTVTTVTAIREIILSAGTFGTPTILQLSGIGDKEDLEAVGIKTIVNNPSVGRNMSDHPLLSNPYLEAVKATKKFVSGAAWKDFIIGPFGTIADTETDEDLEQYIRNNTSTIFHTTGTASMSPKGADWGVVDPDLRVKGVEGLRIIDASVIPFIPNAHTHGPTYLFGERGADLIKQGISTTVQPC